MSNQEYLSLFSSKKSLQYQYFCILRDKEFHCRKCAQKETKSEQLAGGGGVQGLQRGTTTRPGLVIDSETKYCSLCGKKTKHDRWTGEFKTANPTKFISKKLQKRILEHYNYEDCIEQRKREIHELVIDHRFPMERWASEESDNNDDMSIEQIELKFQLLKKDESGNHNLLKSRACEKCIAKGKRGTPMGIKFYYKGTKHWPEDVPQYGKLAEEGCKGCGWYNFSMWRNALNKMLKD